MNIKHLQLNTSLLKDPTKVTQFIVDNEIDIACLQEIVYLEGEESPLRDLFKKTGYEYVEGIHFYNKPKNQIVAAAIVSKWPIIDFGASYFNTADFEPKKLLEEKLLEFDTNNQEFPGTRGLKNWVKSRCVLWAIIKTDLGLVRAITTHYTVSDLCTETVQMLELSRMIKSLIGHSKDLPTIFSTDMNIRAKSYSVTTIEEVLTCHTKVLADTLSTGHQAKIRDFPQGLATDHVFSKGMKHQSTEAVEVDFSEHKAIVSEFELIRKSLL